MNGDETLKTAFISIVFFLTTIYHISIINHPSSNFLDYSLLTIIYPSSTSLNHQTCINYLSLTTIHLHQPFLIPAGSRPPSVPRVGRNGPQEIAQQMGLRATFMAKPFGISGWDWNALGAGHQVAGHLEITLGVQPLENPWVWTTWFDHGCFYCLKCSRAMGIVGGWDSHMGNSTSSTNHFLERGVATMSTRWWLEWRASMLSRDGQLSGFCCHVFVMFVSFVGRFELFVFLPELPCFALFFACFAGLGWCPVLRDITIKAKKKKMTRHRHKTHSE